MRVTGFNPSDYQIQLTRRVRGLPLWFSLAMHGTESYTAALERGIELAKIAGRLITETPYTELVREPSISCDLYSQLGWTSEQYSAWTYRNRRSGFALVAPTHWHTGETNETVSRLCFINPDTTEHDVNEILATWRNDLSGHSVRSLAGKVGRRKLNGRSTLTEALRFINGDVSENYTFF